MKLRLSAAVLAATVLALYTFNQSAKATTISIGNQDTSSLPTGVVLAPTSTTGSFDLSVTGSIPDVYRSPFGDSTTPYSVLSPGNLPTGPSSATFNFGANSAATSVSFLWGSPDSYNSVEFFDTSNNLIATYTGNSLTPPSPGDGFDYITFVATNGAIGSMVLLDSGQAAFEYDSVDPTPLPSTLSLIASGLAVLAFFAYRRKGKDAFSAAVAA
jgi:hypothetical protein